MLTNTDQTQQSKQLTEKIKRLESLKALKTHKGWLHVEDIMRRETYEAAKQLSALANMPDAEMHFRRGAFWAGDQLLNILDNLIFRLENDIKIEAATEDANLRAAQKKGETGDPQ